MQVGEIVPERGMYDLQICNLHDRRLILSSLLCFAPDDLSPRQSIRFFYLDRELSELIARTT